MKVYKKAVSLMIAAAMACSVCAANASGTDATGNNKGGKVVSVSVDDTLPDNPAGVSRFKDVAADSPFVNAIDWAVNKGITNGTTLTTFSPNQTCTNAQILTFLYRAEGTPAVTAACPFNDVVLGSPYYAASRWAAETGIVAGKSGGEACTRSMAVQYLYRMAGEPETSQKLVFNDLKAHTEYIPAIAWAVENGVTNGTSATTFSPATTCTRGQIVTFLYRYMNKDAALKPETDNSDTANNNGTDTESDIPPFDRNRDMSITRKGHPSWQQTNLIYQDILAHREDWNDPNFSSSVSYIDQYGNQVSTFSYHAFDIISGDGFDIVSWQLWGVPHHAPVSIKVFYDDDSIVALPVPVASAMSGADAENIAFHDGILTYTATVPDDVPTVLDHKVRSTRTLAGVYSYTYDVNARTLSLSVAVDSHPKREFFDENTQSYLCSSLREIGVRTKDDLGYDNFIAIYEDAKADDWAKGDASTEAVIKPGITNSYYTLAHQEGDDFTVFAYAPFTPHGARVSLNVVYDDGRIVVLPTPIIDGLGYSVAPQELSVDGTNIQYTAIVEKDSVLMNLANEDLAIETMQAGTYHYVFDTVARTLSVVIDFAPVEATETGN